MKTLFSFITNKFYELGHTLYESIPSSPTSTYLRRIWDNFFSSLEVVSNHFTWSDRKVIVQRKSDSTATPSPTEQLNEKKEKINKQTEQDIKSLPQLIKKTIQLQQLSKQHTEQTEQSIEQINKTKNLELNYLESEEANKIKLDISKILMKSIEQKNYFTPKEINNPNSDHIYLTQKNKIFKILEKLNNEDKEQLNNTIETIKSITKTRLNLYIHSITNSGLPTEIYFTEDEQNFIKGLQVKRNSLNWASNGSLNRLMGNAESIYKLTNTMLQENDTESIKNINTKINPELFHEKLNSLKTQLELEEVDYTIPEFPYDDDLNIIPQATLEVRWKLSRACHQLT